MVFFSSKISICFLFISFISLRRLFFIYFKYVHNFSLKYFIMATLKSLSGNSQIFVFSVLSSTFFFSFSLRSFFLVWRVIFLLQPGYVCIILWDSISYFKLFGLAGFFFFLWHTWSGKEDTALLLQSGGSSPGSLLSLHWHVRGAPHYYWVGWESSGSLDWYWDVVGLLPLGCGKSLDSPLDLF